MRLFNYLLWNVSWKWRLGETVVIDLASVFFSERDSKLIFFGAWQGKDDSFWSKDGFWELSQTNYCLSLIDQTIPLNYSYAIIWPQQHLCLTHTVTNYNNTNPSNEKKFTLELRVWKKATIISNWMMKGTNETWNTLWLMMIGNMLKFVHVQAHILSVNYHYRLSVRCTQQ